ncbi:hypothetical protein AGLY_012713 [Aphis glycines]|uniref:DUF4806 domain-containing protein n=1 Tax=Aphis glycines TaxID=307491 RepID=A0A6G0T8Q5_APHGL|nr:hypothetical protein AGLY_012713 [Aphis glycines]
MENLRNFVVLQFHDGLEIVNKNWIIDENNYFYPVGVKNKNDYFKLLNTMVRPGYHNDKYNWVPHYTFKIYGSDDVFDRAMSKLALVKRYNNVIYGADSKKSCKCNVCVNKYYPPPTPPEEINSHIFENKKNNSVPKSRLLKFLTPLPCFMKQKPTTVPFPFHSSITTNVDIKELSADNLNKNVPTTSTQNLTTTINHYPKKDIPVSKISTRITPSYGSTKFKPFTAKFPPKSTTSTRNISGGTIKDNEPDFSTQSTTSPKNNLIPQLAMSVPTLDVSDRTNILSHLLNKKRKRFKEIKKIVSFEQIITDINLKITRSLANQEKIFNLIEELNRKTLAEKYVNNKVMAEFEDNFISNFPLKTFDDVLELEKLLIEKQNYKLLKTKLLSYSGADLKSLTINILTRLFTNNVAAKLMLSSSNIKRSPTLDGMFKIKLQNKIIYKLVIEVLMQIFKCTEEQIKVPIRSWLKQAKEKNNEVKHSKNRKQ